MDVKARLETLMSERGLTMYRLAKEADIPWSTLRNIFKRGTDPSVNTLESICSGMGITLHEFFNTTDPIETDQAQHRMVWQWLRLNRKDRGLVADLVDSLSQKGA